MASLVRERAAGYLLLTKEVVLFWQPGGLFIHGYQAFPKNCRLSFLCFCFCYAESLRSLLPITVIVVFVSHERGMHVKSLFWHWYPGSCMNR